MAESPNKSQRFMNQLGLAKLKEVESKKDGVLTYDPFAGCTHIYTYISIYINLYYAFIHLLIYKVIYAFIFIYFIKLHDLRLHQQ